MLRIASVAALLVAFTVPAWSQDQKKDDKPDSKQDQKQEQKPARKKKGEPTDQIDLGTVHHTKVPGRWEFDLPKAAKRVEMQMITKEGNGSLNCGYAGVVEINGKDALRWLRKNKDGGYTIKNGITGEDYVVNKENTTDGQWLDISSLCQKGNNRVMCTHYFGELGVRVRYFTK